MAKKKIAMNSERRTFFHCNAKTLYLSRVLRVSLRLEPKKKGEGSLTSLTLFFLVYVFLVTASSAVSAAAEAVSAVTAAETAFSARLHLTGPTYI